MKLPPASAYAPSVMVASTAAAHYRDAGPCLRRRIGPMTRHLAGVCPDPHGAAVRGWKAHTARHRVGSACRGNTATLPRITVGTSSLLSRGRWPMIREPGSLPASSRTRPRESLRTPNAGRAQRGRGRPALRQFRRACESVGGQRLHGEMRRGASAALRRPWRRA